MRKIACLLLIMFSCIFASAEGTNLENLTDTIPSDASASKPGDVFYVDGEKFTTPDKAAYYKNPKNGWMNYFKNRIASKIAEIGYGSCSVGFVIDENGNTKDVKVVDMSNPDLAKIVVEIIKKSPKWTPAILHGEPVKSYRVQPFTVSGP